MTALRLLGAALVALSGWALGRERRARLYAAADALSAVCTALGLLRSEITERRAPLPEIARRLCKEGPLPCRGWFAALSEGLDAPGEARFSALWERALRAGRLPLGAEETAALCRLGLSLGRYDAPEQAEAIDGCLAVLTRAQRRASDAAREKGKLCTGLGLAGGLLIAVLLL